MPSILDRLLGRKPVEETKAEQAKAAEDVARARREELARKQQEAEAARKRFEESEKVRLAALAAEKLAAEAKAKAAATSASSWAQAAPAQATTTTTTTTAATERTYVVKSGDSLSKIAKELYGDAKRWPEIYEANKQLIGDNPNLIQVGHKLRIP